MGNNFSPGREAVQAMMEDHVARNDDYDDDPNFNSSKKMERTTTNNKLIDENNNNNNNSLVDFNADNYTKLTTIIQDAIAQIDGILYFILYYLFFNRFGSSENK